MTFIHTHTTQLKKDINLFTKYIKGYSVEAVNWHNVMEISKEAYFT